MNRENADIPSAPRGRIVALSSTLWHDPQWMNRQHICSRLAARGWRVVYSNGPLAFSARHSQRWRQAPWMGGVETDGELRVVEAGRLRASMEKVPPFSTQSARHHAQTLIAASGGPPDWLLLFSPRYAEYIDLFPGARVAYHVHDHFPGFPNWNRSKEYDHRLIVERADLITASSASIARDLPPPGAERAIVMPNGANVAAFEAGEKAPCPADLASIPRPRILYAGALNAKLDFGLVLRCATERPSHHWIFVGPEVEGLEDIAELQALRRLANVHFLGLRCRRDIPAYLAHSDVATIPYHLRGGWAFHCSPNKLPEALAAGKPLIATPIPAVTPFSGVAALAASADAWLAALDAAVDGSGVGTMETRRRVARDHDWESWVDRYEALLLASCQESTRSTNGGARADSKFCDSRHGVLDIEASGESSWRT